MKPKAKFSLVAMLLCIACVFSVMFAVTAFADNAEELTSARASGNENLVARTETTLGNDYRSGYNSAASFNGGVITVTRPEGTDARVGNLLINSAMNKTEVLKGGEIVATSALSVYYAADMVFGDYENQYATYGFTVAKTVSGSSTTYHTLTLEQGRGFLHYYTFVDSPANEADAVPVVVEIPAAKVKGDTVKMEIIKSGDEFKVYINGTYTLSTTIANATPIFGTMMFDTDVTYSNMVFKYLDANVDVDTVVTIPAKLASAREAQGSYATGMGATSMTGNLRSADTKVGYSNGVIESTIDCNGDWINSANQLTDDYLSQSTVKNSAGEEVATSSIGALVSAEVAYTGTVLEYRKIGVLFGYKAEGAATRYFALVYEPGRGFVFVYSFVREANGGVSTETEPAVYTSTNLGFAANKAMKFEIIVEASGISAYINNIEVAKEIASAEGLDLTGVTPIVGAMFRETQGTVANASLKYLEKVNFVFPIPEKLAAARNNGTNVTEGLTLTASANLRDGGRNMIAFENGIGRAVKENDGRDARMFTNKELRQEQALVNGEVVNTSELSVYYKADLAFADKGNQYGYFGIMVGKNTVEGYNRYYNLVIEPLRGFVFLYWFDVNGDGNTVREGNINVMVSGDIGIKANVEKTLEVIKEGDKISVYYGEKEIVNGFTDDGFKNVTPVFGLKTFDASATYKNFEMKVLTEGYEFYIPDTRPTFTTENIVSDVENIANATKTENGFVFNGESEYSAVVEGVKDYVYVQEEGVYKRVNDATLNAYVQVKLTFGEFASPKEGWYGAGVTFRGEYANGYAIRLLGSSALLMKNGNEVASTGIAAIEVGSEVLVQILSTPNTFTAWINGNAVFENYKINEGYNCSFGIHVVYNAVTASDLSMQYNVEVYDANPNASDDATLKYINLDGEALEGFAADKTEYFFNLERGSEAPEVNQFKVEANHEYASVVTTKENDVIVIAVTAENGTVKRYVITYEIDKNSDSTVKSISIGGTAIAVEQGKTEYNFTMPAHEQYPAQSAVVVEANDEFATAEVAVSNGKVTITVTAEDGSQTVYTINVALNLSSNSALASITVKGQEVAGVNGEILEYTFATNEAVTEADIEFVCADEYANASYVFENNKAIITVTAEDGSTSVYTVTIVEEAATTGSCFGAIGFESVIFAGIAMAAAVILKKKEN